MSRIREVRLGELDALARSLGDAVTASGFTPDLVVYVERGSRLVAVRLASDRGWAILPLHVRRPRTVWKRALTPFLRRLPRAMKDAVRRWEQWRTFSRRGARQVLPPERDVDLAERDILIVDDAADSGSSVLAARSWAISRGADPGRTRAAVLTATTAMGRSVVDYALSGDHCRFPWSSDSADHAAFEREYEALEQVVRDLCVR